MAKSYESGVRRFGTFLWLFLSFGLLSLALGRAAVVKSYQELSAAQIMDLRSSEERVIADDRALQALESDRKNKKISEQDFAWQYHDLVAYISGEASFQNDILTKHSQDFELPEGATRVLRTVGKYSILVPAYALAAVAKGMAASGTSYSFSP
jgi:hypothetical protein